jgi:CBS domain-containing protein
MSAPAVAVTPETTIEHLTASMGAHDFNAFPVVNEVGALLGLVSRSDLVRLYLLHTRASSRRSRRHGSLR